MIEGAGQRALVQAVISAVWELYHHGVDLLRTEARSG